MHFSLLATVKMFVGVLRLTKDRKHCVTLYHTKQNRRQNI